MASALLMTTSLAGCAAGRIAESAGQRAAAEQVGGAIKAVTALPENPADCAVRERSGVRLTDRLDVALLKTDQVLTRANTRISRCDVWYKKLREVRHGNAS